MFLFFKKPDPLEQAVQESFEKGRLHPLLDIRPTTKQATIHLREADNLLRKQRARRITAGAERNIWGD